MAKQNFPGVSRRISTKYLYPRFDFPLQINQNHSMTFFRLRVGFKTKISEELHQLEKLTLLQ